MREWSSMASVMHIVPGPRHGCGGFRSPCGAMAGCGEAAQLLDVEMEQVAGGGMFVALYRRTRLQIADTAESMAAEDAADGGPAQAYGLRDPAAGPALAAQKQNLFH